jgi:transcriptional regulator with XRE-family HTH domain
MTASVESFGRRLRDRRESLGISLDAIASATKIKKAFLVDLERDDVSRWPRGVFRRAFVKAYAEAIHLPPDAVLNEFASRFPEDGSDGAEQVAAPQPSTLRLTLADDRSAARRASLARAIAATLEAGALVSIATAVSWLTQVSLLASVAIVAVPYYAVTSAWQRGLATRCASWLQARSGGPRVSRAPADLVRARLRIVPRPLARPRPEVEDAAPIRIAAR